MSGPARLALAATFVLGLVLLAVRVADARTVSVPLTVDYPSLRTLLLAEVYTQPDGTAAVWREGGCNVLLLADPLVGNREGRLRVTSAAKAGAAVELGGHCLGIDWTGTVEAVLEPRVESRASAVHFRIVDSSITGGTFGSKLLAETVGGWVKRYAEPRLETLVLDLGTPLGELRHLLPAFLPSDDAARTDAILASVVMEDPRVDDEGVGLHVRFDVPDVAPTATRVATPTVVPTPTAVDTAAPTPSPEPSAAEGEPDETEPPLGDPELAAIEDALDHWDGFVTFVVKQVAGETENDDVRRELLSILLDARYELVGALAAAKPGDPDPVRVLFLHTWRRLRPVLRKLTGQLPAEGTLRYLGFVAGGDALRALDEIGPSTGLDISADGLRRLARTLAPDTTGDPLVYDRGVDPELRRLFGFGPPLPPPEDDSGSGTSGSFDWLGVAWAAGTPIKEITSRLNKWVPAPDDDVQPYLEQVRQLLHATTDEILAKGQVEGPWHDGYRALVLATAWQETCWRQFVRVGGKLRAIRSPVGAIGLMQVNQRVWRGFYDLKGLRSDIAYNARAGAEILVRYMVDDVLGASKPPASEIDNIALAVYAVYNGGPSRLRKLAGRLTPRLGPVGPLFAEKYRTIRGGDELGVIKCYREG